MLNQNIPVSASIRKIDTSVSIFYNYLEFEINYFEVFSVFRIDKEILS